MVITFNRLFSFVNWTDPATETKSIRLAADALVPCIALTYEALSVVFARHRDYFSVTRNFTSVYEDLVLFRSFTVTPSSLTSTGTP
jgi:hypothetical protein